MKSVFPLYVESSVLVWKAGIANLCESIRLDESTVSFQSRVEHSDQVEGQFGFGCALVLCQSNLGLMRMAFHLNPCWVTFFFSFLTTSPGARLLTRVEYWSVCCTGSCKVKPGTVEPNWSYEMSLLIHFRFAPLHGNKYVKLILGMSRSKSWAGTALLCYLNLM